MAASSCFCLKTFEWITFYSSGLSNFSMSVGTSPLVKNIEGYHSHAWNYRILLSHYSKRQGCQFSFFYCSEFSKEESLSNPKIPVIK